MKNIDSRAPSHTLHIMTPLLQTGLNGHLPAPPEKRFLISKHGGRTMRKTTLLITLILTMFGARVAFGVDLFVDSVNGSDAKHRQEMDGSPVVSIWEEATH